MPSKLDKPIGGDKAALPARTPRLQANGRANNTSIQQALTRQAETIDSILDYLNATIAPTAPTKAIDSGTGVSSTTPNPQDTTFQGNIYTPGTITAKGGAAFSPDLTVDRDLYVGRNAAVAGDASITGKVSSAKNTVVASKGDAVVSINSGAGTSPTFGNCFAAVPSGGGLGWRVTNPANTRNVAYCDATGKITSGPFDASGDSIVRGSLRVTGTVTPGFAASPPTPYGFGTSTGGDPDVPPPVDPPATVDNGNLTVDGSTWLNKTNIVDDLTVTAPATFIEHTTFTDITATGTMTLHNQEVTTQQVSESSHVMGAFQADGDSTMLGNVYFGGFGTPASGDGMTPQATASVISGVITGTDITASGAISTGTLTASGDVAAATMHATSATLSTITNTSITSGTANITTANITNLNTNGTTVSGGNIVASDVKTTTATVSGALSAGSLSTGSVSATGAVTAGTVTAGTVTSSGALVGASLNVSGTSSLAAISATSLSTSGSVSVGTTANVTGALTAGSITSNTGISGASVSTTGAISGASLTISGNSQLSGTTTVGTLNAGASTLNSLAVTNLATVSALTVTTGPTSITGGATVNGQLQAPNGIVTTDILTNTFNTTGAMSVGTSLAVGTNATVIGSVTTANILATAGYLTALPQAHYLDTAYVANTFKACQYIFWNVSGSNGILGTGIGSTAYAANMDYAYVAPVAGSLSAITGYVATGSAATVTIALYVNGTSAFTGTTTTTAGTRKYFALTSTRGALAFTAGAYLQLYVKSSLAQTTFYTLLTPHVYL